MIKQISMLILLGLIIIIEGCIHPDKSVDSATARGVASADAPNDFEPDRNHFEGSIFDLAREFKLMRGNLERNKVLNIATERKALLENNLFDTGAVPSNDLDCQKIMALGRTDFLLHHRTVDGTCYMHNQGSFLTKAKEADISHLKNMGSRDTRFGRNSAPISREEQQQIEKNILEPNPIVLSQTFFSRKKELAPETDGFQPVPWVNLLATAWLQGQNHDWFSHGKNVDTANLPAEQLEMYANMYRPYQVDGFIIPRTQPDMSFLEGKFAGVQYQPNKTGEVLETKQKSYGRKYKNTVTQWWDASQIYGSDQKTVTKVRTIPSGVIYKSNNKIYASGALYPDGKIAVDEVARKLYYRPDLDNDNEILPITGFHDNWWIGLEMIHTIFALEHNKVASMLKNDLENTTLIEKLIKNNFKNYYLSLKTDNERSDFIFHKARLVVSALIAKIHTVEWTPALLDNPGLRMGMFANWHGLKTAVGDIESIKIRNLIQNNLGADARMLISGLTGEGTLNLYNVPFSLTEEFVSVYRMHSLLSDNINLMKYNTTTDKVETVVPIDKARDGDVEKLYTDKLKKYSSMDWLYSFGRNKAGLMTLHNYPKFMENMDVRRNIQGQKKDQPIKMNMGAVDIVRDRERHVPRYNAFRRSLRMRPLKDFEELFVTSKILYEDASTKSSNYQLVLNKLKDQIQADSQKYDMPMIERDVNKIESVGVIGNIKNAINGGKDGLLNAGVNLVPEPVFYEYYYALPENDRKALLTNQEIEDIANMRKLYNNDVEKLDLLVGTLAEEDRFDQFGFGNTPFYIFALMASRRLMSDPFLSDLYTDEVYSKAGKNWVEKETMISVIIRNFPELAPKLKGVKNAFHPWNPN